MQIKWGEEYRGPGQADPSKSRAQREAELRGLLNSSSGKEIVEYYFLKYTGAIEGKMPPVGAPLIETILNHEYPKNG